MNFDFSGIGFPFGVGVFWIVAFWITTIIVHITFAVAVYRDAKRFGTPIFVESIIWMLATLIGGVVTAAIYWALHHSSLNTSNRSTSTETDKEAIL
ncbi:MAG: hypothetical protein OXU23_24990 [Candidatus Poribacteria bacterium]|nr:hypothetical protein [Candidatus Poribacteria bacterium]MDE0316467.1 hypothetical protein [Candidatus Poribacteria bacterium]